MPPRRGSHLHPDRGGAQALPEGCSSCHGLNAEGIDGATVNNGGNGGPSLIGVGSAAVHFQVSSGRMPLANPGAQAPAKTEQYSDEEVAALAAYVASLAPARPRPRLRSRLQRRQRR